jgi:hypothetical protein
MAITEVDLDFTYSYGSVQELALEGDETNPSSQVALDMDDSNASSVLNIDLGGLYTTVPTLNGNGSVAQIDVGGELEKGNSFSFSKNVVQVRMEGSLVVKSKGAASLSVLQLRASGSMFVNPVVQGDASVVEVSMEGSGFVSNSMNMDKEVIILSMTGRLIQGEDESGSPIIIPADDDTEYPSISGEEYIVVNLRTKAHSTYRDGERTAVAKTGSMDFGTYSTKAVTDMFMLSRAKGDMEVLVNTKEDVERRYPLSHGSTQQANMKNKKLPLGKGLRGVNWSLAIVVPDEAHLEIRGIELLVTDLKRRT